LDLKTKQSRLAKLTMFYHIHYNWVSISMPQTSKMYSDPTHTENKLQHSNIQLWLSSSFIFSRTVRQLNILPQHIVQLEVVKTFKHAILTI